MIYKSKGPQLKVEALFASSHSGLRKSHLTNCKVASKSDPGGLKYDVIEAFISAFFAYYVSQMLASYASFSLVGLSIASRALANIFCWVAFISSIM